MVTVYDYLSAEKYLLDAWSIKRQKNPQFSVRAWAGQLGLKYHGPLHQILLGNRKIPKHYVPSLIRSLSLSPKEGLYFETLVDLQRSRTLEEKEVYTQRLQELSPKPQLKMFEIESYRYLKIPLHGIILEMCYLKDFSKDLKWIQSRLDFKVSLGEIHQALERLFSLGLILEDANGVITRTHRNIFSKSDIPNTHLQEYHVNCSNMAIRAVQNQAVAEREFNATTLNIQMKDLTKAKESLRRYLNQFVAEFESPEGLGEETYHLNLQLFKITKRN